MKKKIQKILQTLFPNKIPKKQRQILMEWESNGRPVPPPHIVKQLTIKEFQKNYSYEILVETGTYKGTMVEAQKKNFRKIYSVELGDELYNDAKRKFEGDKNVTIVHGDSGKVLPDILSKINEPTIFWLDGHYSAGITARGDKDCPIFEEMDAILSKKNFEPILLIDDARCFTGEGDYPTLEELTNYITSKNDKYHVDVKDDIIRCVAT